MCKFRWGETHLEPWIGFFEESIEFSLCSLLRSKRDQHCKINMAEVPFVVTCRGTALGQNDVVYKKRRTWVALFQGGNHAAQDLDAIAIVVVVQALSYEEGVRVVYGLRIEEVVLLEGQAAFDILDGCALLLR